MSFKMESVLVGLAENELSAVFMFMQTGIYHRTIKTNNQTLHFTEFNVAISREPVSSKT